VGIYKDTLARIENLIAGESDLVAVMSTISCEIYHSFEVFNWVGFYRRVDERTLKVGPYQGGHGCLTIDRDRGVCGACFRQGKVQIENDVRLAPSHIACSSETQAEIVLPVFDQSGAVVAVLDVDALKMNVFDQVDVEALGKVCRWVGQLWPDQGMVSRLP